MADYYVDAVNGASANVGTEALPKQFISETTTTANNRVFLKRGQVHTISTYKFFNSNTVLSAYGTGFNPIIRKTVGGDGWIYARNGSNIRFENFDIDGANLTGPLLVVSVAASNTSDVTISNVNLYGSSTGIGLYMAGDATNTVTNIFVKDTTSSNNGQHGFFVGRNVAGVIYLRCKSFNNGARADAHGFTSFSTLTPYPEGIQYYFCEAYGNIDSSPTQIEGAGFQFDDNTKNSTAIGCYSHNNQGAGFTFNTGSGNRVIGCISSANEGPAVLVNTNTGAKVINNTFIGNCLSSLYYSSEVVLTNTSTGGRVDNNILIDSKAVNPTGITFSANSVSGSSATTNCIYGFTTTISGLAGTGTIITDPKITKFANIDSTSPCIGAGTLSAELRYFNGQTPSGLVDIGAIPYSAARSIIERIVG